MGVKEGTLTRCTPLGRASSPHYATRGRKGANGATTNGIYGREAGTSVAAKGLTARRSRWPPTEKPSLGSRAGPNLPAYLQAPNSARAYVLGARTVAFLWRRPSRSPVSTDLPQAAISAPALRRCVRTITFPVMKEMGLRRPNSGLPNPPAGPRRRKCARPPSAFRPSSVGPEHDKIRHKD